MALRGQRPLTWHPQGLSDAFDGTTAFEGAMSRLDNLIPAQNNAALWVPRPAATRLTIFPGFSSPGEITQLITAGDITYGMISSADFAGKDEPFAFNLRTGSFLTVTGTASANLPTTQATSGDWTVPTIAVVGNRVVFTHPGFAGGTSTAASYAQVTGNVHNGSPTIDGAPAVATGGPGAVFTTLPAGLMLFGTGIPANTTIVSSALVNISTTGTGTSGTNTFTVPSATGIAIGQSVYGSGIPGSTTVTNVSGTTITISQNLTANLTGSSVFFAGATITMSANGTASNNGVAISAVGGAGGAVNFGWLDISGFTATTTANTVNGAPVLTGNPNILGVQPGMAASGTGIAAGATVTSASNVVIVVPNCTTTSGSQTILNVSPPAGAGQLALGQTVAGAGIPTGSYIIGIVGTTVIINQAMTASGTVTLTFTGALIVLSANDTADGNQVNITISGGTAASPQWAAGDTNGNGLKAVPVFAAQFYGRCYFGVNVGLGGGIISSGVTASDVGVACNVTNANQVITFSDGIPVTAAAGLALFNQLGGIVQSLMVFQGAANIRQITGDFALGTWAENSLQTATGTLAPDAIAPSPQGLFFMAPDGLRMIDFDARVSEPIGVRGQGIQLPFINAMFPSRMTASYNENVYRVSVTWTNPSTNPTVFGVAPGATARQEFWYHLDIKRWSGPHSFPANTSAPWQSKNSFIMSRPGVGALWQSDAIPTGASLYSENSVALTWTYATALLPDNPEQMANHIVESSVFMSLPATTQALATAIDDQGTTLDQTYVFLGPTVTRAQQPMAWHNPVVFRQLSVSLAGPSSGGVLLGSLCLRYQQLGYQLTPQPNIEFILGQSILGGGDVLGP
jgi:hypothetical protein